MSDTYQAVYDAVRSKISGGNVDEAIERSFRDSGLSHYAQQAFLNIEQYQTAPSVLMRPRLFIDGGQWCALYGENIQDGVCGFGDSPALAMYQFDLNWHKGISK